MKQQARRHWKWIAPAIVVVAALAAGEKLRQQSQQQQVAETITGGRIDRASELMRRYGCGGCHTVAGLTGADGQVGPALADLRERVFIGGQVRNTPDNLVRWIVSPQTFSPQSAMPTTGITEAEARDVAAYLYSQ
jgi:cytochrome c2